MKLLVVVVALTFAASVAVAAAATPKQGQLGIFLHYGPSSLLNAPDETQWIARIQAPSYVQTVATFRPNTAAVSEWVALAKKSGASYIVFTAKHHDGYTLWHSDVAVDRSAGANDVQWNARADQDVVAALAKACRTAHIKLYLYFSLVDWYEHAYRVGNASAHLAIEEAQLRELLTNYGPIDGVWLDGVWSPTHLLSFWSLDEIKQEIRTLQPNTLIGVNRFSTQIEDNEDFAITEKSLPAKPLPWPTEAVFPIGRLWFYSTQDALKTPQQLRSIIANSIGRGFDLLLDVPPRSDGSIDPAYLSALLRARAAAPPARSEKSRITPRAKPERRP